MTGVPTSGVALGVHVPGLLAHRARERGSAAAMVFLEPSGDHERRNAERWESNGFAVDGLREARLRLLDATAYAPGYSRTLTPRD